MPAPEEGRIRIRPLREADVEAIIEIDARISGEEKAGFWRGLLTLYEPGGPAGEAEEDRPREPGPARPSPTYLCEVAESGGRVVGFILGDVQPWQFGMPRCGRIIAVGVRPEERGSGVGSRLAREILEAFRKMDLDLVQCLVRPGDPLGAFFASLGFAPSSWLTLEKPLT
jgi:ribosomal protein S18 acetylase RimI-like enzyme